MARSLRTLLALGAIFVAVLAFSACGDGVPGNAVVRVGDDVIKTSTFDHWMQLAAKSSQAPGSSGKVSVPKPPDFNECIDAKTKALGKPQKGQPRPSRSAFKSQCKQEYEGLRDQVLQFLISAQWVIGEASDQDIKLTDKDIEKSFNQQKKQSFKTDKEFQKFLKDSGMSIDDIKFRVRLDLLSNKIREKVTKDTGSVTDADVEKYYNDNKDRFAQPETRDVLLVLTSTKKKADEARAALDSGQSFKDVAKKYSIDEQSKLQGGKQVGIPKGQQDPALDKAMFAAKVDELVGPVKTQFGYYIFKVTKTHAKSQQTLKESRASIKALLKSQNQQKALDKFVKKFRKKWQDETNCKKGFVVDSCKNAPKKKSGTNSAAPGEGGATPTTGGNTPNPSGG